MAAIFDMDGLLLDTEPLWGESMLKVAQAYQVPIDKHFFKHTTGLRITEVTAFWKERYPWPGKASSEQLAADVIDDIIALSKLKGAIMPGVVDCLNWLQSQNISIGLATSSPTRMMNDLVNHFGLSTYFNAMTSADTAHYGKPHPEVYLQCAAHLGAIPWHCVALEDSVNPIPLIFMMTDMG
jgi:HAD superfamily hydrolase (TIGR01509 family)